MVMIVEDGSGVDGANSYVSVEYADAFFDARGRSDWHSNADHKEKALIKSTDYIDAVFGYRFKAQKFDPFQPLEFPRFGLYDRYQNVVIGIPDNLKKATCEYAVRVISGSELLQDPNLSTTDFLLQSKKVKVGPIEEQYSYDMSNRPYKKLYPAADNYLRDYIDNRLYAYR